MSEIKKQEFTLGEVIRSLRIRKKLKQEELSKLSGLPRSVISAHETGRRTPSKFQIQRYNEVFECDITNFVPLKNKEPMLSKSIRLSEHLYSELQKEAEKNQMEVSQYIRGLLEKGVQEDYITRSMDTLIILIQEAMERILKKDVQQNKEIPIMLLQCIYMMKYLMRDSLRLSSIEIDSVMDDIKHMAREEYYRRKGKGDS